MKKGLIIALIAAGTLVTAGAVTTAVILTKPALEHVCEAGEWIVDIEPSCVKEGQRHKACVQCGLILEVETIEALGHDSSDWIVDQEATYTESGSRHKECMRCGENLITEGIPMIGHTCTYGEWAVITAPTCTKEGKHKHTCTTCGLVQEEIMDPLGHHMIHHSEIAAECTTEGAMEHWYCDRCNEYFSDAKGAHTISENDIATEALGHHLAHTEAQSASCTANGNIEYWYCENCHKYFSDEACTLEILESELVITATGHAKTHFSAQSASCTESGNIEYWTCIHCSKYFSDEACTNEITAEQTVVAAAGHQTAHTFAVSPTCTKTGNIDYWTCGICHKIFSDAACTTEITLLQTIVQPLGHTLTKHNAVAASCEQNGSIDYWTCSRCNGVFNTSSATAPITMLSTIVGSLGHNYQNGECTHCHQTEPGAYTKTGNTIVFGSYPQTQVTDSSLITILNFLAGSTPTTGQASRGNWTSYGYYENEQVKHYMWYQDIYCDNYRYRGVYFTEYRPSSPMGLSNTSWSRVDDNGYSVGTIYWFKWAPLSWRVLSENGGYFLFCNTCIDAQEFDSTDSIYYDVSTIRTWLNGTFYQQAFSASQRVKIQTTLVDNSVDSTLPRGARRIYSNYCSNTSDKVFLLSAYELTDSQYSFEEYNVLDSGRQLNYTQYAMSQGFYSQNYPSFYWLTRSASHFTPDMVSVVQENGIVGTGVEPWTAIYGIVPALWITP